MANSRHLKSIKNDKSAVAWTEKMDEAFLHCNQILSENILLTFPDPESEILVLADAFSSAIWKASQPLASYSRKLSPTEKKYLTYDRELLAAYATDKKFSFLLEGRTFGVFSDHRPLAHAFKKNSENFLRGRFSISPTSANLLGIFATYRESPAHAPFRIESVV